MRRPAVFLVLAVFAAVLASMVVYSSLKKKDEEMRRALAGTTTIVVAAHDIGVGAKIDAASVKLARWPRDSLPPGAVTDAASVLGNLAKAEFVTNEPIVASRLVAGDRTSGVLPLMIPPDMRAMSVAVDEVSDMSGFVLPYTRVDVLLSTAGNDKQPERSKIILENVPVLAVAQTIERKDNPQPERVVTLEVTPEQAEALAVASTQGKLHLALRNYGDNSVVATSGADVHKVMSAYSTAVPEPAPIQESKHVRLPVREFVRHLRPLATVELLRDGQSRETIVIGRNGMAMPSARREAGAHANDGTPSVYRNSLGGDDGQNSDTYGSDNGVSDSGMGGSGVGINSGVDK